MWLRDYGEAIEADLLFRGIDLLDFYRGRITARRLYVLVDNLPPESSTIRMAYADSNAHTDATASSAGANGTSRLRPVTCLEDIPVVSPGQAMKLVNASPDEFASMTTRNQAS